MRFDSDKYSMNLSLEGILEIRHKDNVQFNIEDAINQRDKIIQLVEGKRTPFLIDVRVTNWDATKEVRKFHASDEKLLSVRSAEAILVNNLGMKILANFYNKFNRPPNPVKVFTNEVDALNWLCSICNKK